MNGTHIIVVHGGVWNEYGDKYENGVQEYVRIPHNGLTYDTLVSLIGKVVNAENNSIFVYSVMEAANGSNLRMKLTDDDDLRHVMEVSDILKFYVTNSSNSMNHLSQLPPSTSIVANSFVSLLNAQNSISHPYSFTPPARYIPTVGGVTQSGHEKHVENASVESGGNDIDWGRDWDCDDEEIDADDDGHDNEDILDVENNDDDIDDCCVRSHNIIPPTGRSCVDEDVQNDTRQERTTHGRQWIIPGALFHASLPIEQLGIDVNTRDEVCVGTTFATKEKMSTALGFYHMVNRVEYRTDRSIKTRFTAICKKSEECSFLMRAVCCGTVWRVIKFRVPHTCQLDLSRQSPRTVSSMVVATFFAPRLLDEGAILKPKEMQTELQRQYGVEVSYGRALAARNHAIRMIYGDQDKSFQLLPSYLYMLEQSNPGSVTDLQTHEDGRFKYTYMALAASITGFLSCGRPVIVVDGTHLKGKYRGVMFVAATQDGNEQIFPLAVGIGDKESDHSWNWFMRQVRKTFGCPDNLLFVSDQHISIKNALETVYPEIPHGICTYHLQNNLSRWGAHVVSMYQQCAYSYRTQDFDRHMNNILIASENGAYKKLMDVDPIRWARSKCPVRRYGFLNSNCAECFNGRLRWARKLPICALLEFVRTLIGHWFVERRQVALARNHELTKYAADIVEENVKYGQTMGVEAISVSRFKVTCGMKTYIVDIAGKECSCREFDLDLIPCPHAAAVLSKANYSLSAYVSSYYTTKNLSDMYSMEIMPILHPEDWDIPLPIKSRTVNTPSNPRQAGRPPTSRIRSRSQSSSRSRSKVCSRCKKSCHNRVNCTEYIPLSKDSTSGTNETVNEVGSNISRRPKSCNICHVVGHTRLTCRERPA